MNESLLQRVAAVTGLALAAAMAVWWRGSARRARGPGAEAARSAGDARNALLLVRGMALAVLCPRIGALRGWRPAVATGLGLIGPSWPVVLLAWSASTAPLAGIALGEVLLLLATVVLPLLGVGLRRWLRPSEIAVIIGTVLGIALSAAVWRSRSLWVMALS